MLLDVDTLGIKSARVQIRKTLLNGILTDEKVMRVKSFDTETKQAVVYGAICFETPEGKVSSEMAKQGKDLWTGYGLIEMKVRLPHCVAVNIVTGEVITKEEDIL
jgi:hypothetical protein